MSNSTSACCCVCRSSRIKGTCDCCHQPTCRACLRTLEADAFPFYDKLPATLAHVHYCDRCYAEHVEPARSEYEARLEKAKNFLFIPKTYRGPLFILGKATHDVQVSECPDRDETILRLAFLAADGDFNAIIDGDVVSRKVRNFGYQKSIWSGRAVPARLDEAKLDRNDYLEEVWRRGR